MPIAVAFPLHANTGTPQYLQVHLVMRNRHGSANEAKVELRLSLPGSSRSTAIKEPAYLESYAAAVARHYAYLAYKETGTESGKWVVKLEGKVTASTTIDQGPLRRQIRDAAGAGRNISFGLLYSRGRTTRGWCRRGSIW